MKRSKAFIKSLRLEIASLYLPSIGSGAVRHTVPGHPFDSYYLAHSPLYRKSRRFYILSGGRFEPYLTSAKRAADSINFLRPVIEYSPIEAELLWALEVNDSSASILLDYTLSLFHEQNHRLLWKWLSPPQRLTAAAIRKYLNFCEALVVALDMAVADEMTPVVARLGHLANSLYNGGIKIKFKTRRARHLYYHAIAQAVFLLLEGYEAKNIVRVLPSLYPEVRSLDLRAAATRVSAIDRVFVNTGNPVWQRRNQKMVKDELTKIKQKPNKKKQPLYFQASASTRFTFEYKISSAILRRFSI